MTTAAAGTPLPPPAPPVPRELPQWPQTAHWRSEKEHCQRNTPGCSIDHVPGTDWACEPW